MNPWSTSSTRERPACGSRAITSPSNPSLMPWVAARQSASPDKPTSQHEREPHGDAGPRSGAVRSEIGVELAGQAPGQLQSAAPDFRFSMIAGSRPRTFPVLS